MGVAQDFKETFQGIQFYLVGYTDGLGRFKSDYVIITELNKEIFFEVIASLKDNFSLPTQIFIQDIYKISDQRIHNIDEFENVPVKTNRIFDYCYENRI